SRPPPRPPQLPDRDHPADRRPARHQQRDGLAAPLPGDAHPGVYSLVSLEPSDAALSLGLLAEALDPTATLPGSSVWTGPRVATPLTSMLTEDHDDRRLRTGRAVPAARVRSRTPGAPPVRAPDGQLADPARRASR